MHVWSVSSDDATDTEISKMADDKDLDWRFDDWRKTREVSIKKNFFLMKIPVNIIEP
jgi:hypothetical protein